MTEVIVLKEGTHPEIASYDSEIECIIDPICSSVTLIKGKENIIVDCGNFGFEEEILENLHNAGLEPKRIDYVIITHHHPDHWLGTYLFRHAKLVINTGVLQDKRGTYYKDAGFITIPGVERIKTPGHTPSHMSVVVKADKTYVIAGDAIRYDMLEQRCKNDDELKSARRILEIADIVIPGHGPVIEGEKLEEYRRKLG
ncbi:MBL fold metallo-hydrolase [Candidatus Woesearchaeota archaeon]|nr:MBL fold metallo-hydrolase [Candidatus Woesearchaeota archaeon]